MKSRAVTVLPDTGGHAAGAGRPSSPFVRMSTLPFEGLCARLAAVAGDGKLRDVLFTGPALGVGVSTVARQFAYTLAATGERVLLIKVTTDSSGGAPVRSAEELLPFVRPSESLPTLGTLALESARLPVPTIHNGEVLSTLVQDWRSRYDSIVWDVPPIDVLPAAGLIARSVGGVVLVLHAGHTRWHAARHHAERLRYAGANLLGVVLNRKKTYIPSWIYRLFFR